LQGRTTRDDRPSNVAAFGRAIRVQAIADRIVRCSGAIRERKRACRECYRAGLRAIYRGSTDPRIRIVRASSRA
jgi:hypothetical protein